MDMLSIQLQVLGATFLIILMIAVLKGDEF